MSAATRGQEVHRVSSPAPGRRGWRRVRPPRRGRRSVGREHVDDVRRRVERQVVGPPGRADPAQPAARRRRGRRRRAGLPVRGPDVEQHLLPRRQRDDEDDVRRPAGRPRACPRGWTASPSSVEVTWRSVSQAGERGEADARAGWRRRGSRCRPPRRSSGRCRRGPRPAPAAPRAPPRRWIVVLDVGAGGARSSRGESACAESLSSSSRPWHRTTPKLDVPPVRATVEGRATSTAGSAGSRNEQRTLRVAMPRAPLGRRAGDR